MRLDIKSYLIPLETMAQKSRGPQVDTLAVEVVVADSLFLSSKSEVKHLDERIPVARRKEKLVLNALKLLSHHKKHQ